MNVTDLPALALEGMIRYPRNLWLVALRPSRSFLAKEPHYKNPPNAVFFALYSVAIGFWLSSYVSDLARPVNWASYGMLMGILVVAAVPLAEVFRLPHDDQEDEQVADNASAAALTALAISYLLAVGFSATLSGLAQGTANEIDDVATFFGSQAVFLFVYAILLTRVVAPRTVQVRIRAAQIIGAAVFTGLFIFIAYVFFDVLGTPGADVDTCFQEGFESPECRTE